MNYLIVQLTGNEALFARFQLKRGALVFAGASRETMGKERSFASMLEEAAAAAGEDEKVVLALQPALLFQREMGLPLSDRRKVREILPLELKGETALDTDELLFDALPMESGKILAIWGKRPDIAEQIAVMTDKGLEPEIVTAALFHWHALLPDGAGDSPVALCDGESLAVYTGGKPCLFRPLRQGDPRAEITRTLAALEISKGIKVEKVLLHGFASGIETGPSETPPAFALLACNKDMADVFGGLSGESRDLAGTYAVARACAFEEPVNFRSGALAYTAGRRKTLKKLRLTMILAAACLTLLIAETSLRYFLVKRDLDSVNKSIASIYREVFPKRKKPVDEVGELRSEIKRLGGGATTASLLKNLKKLAELKGADITALTEIDANGDELRVRGDARSIQAVNDFRTRAAAHFTGAEVGEIKSRPDGSVTFLFHGKANEVAR